MDSETIKTLESINKDFISYVAGNANNLGFTPPPFFIPFDLQVKMEGLSGMKIFEKFAIN